MQQPPPSLAQERGNTISLFPSVSVMLEPCLHNKPTKNPEDRCRKAPTEQLQPPQLWSRHWAHRHRPTAWPAKGLFCLHNQHSWPEV